MKKIFLFCLLIAGFFIADAQIITFGFTQTWSPTSQTLTLSATSSMNIPNSGFSSGRLALRIPIDAMTGANYSQSSYGRLGFGFPDPNFSSVSWPQGGIAQFSDLGTGTTGITTFIPSDLGGTNDGYVYIFTNYNNGVNGAMTAGVPVPLLQFTVPLSWNCQNNGGLNPCVQILGLTFNSVPWISINVGQVDLSIQQASVCGGFCNIASFGPNGPLPVKLKTFNAALGANCQARLEWAASSESNFKQYEIQYSTNAVDYTTIGIAASKGDNSHYEFFHNPKQGKAYYRLKIVDKDDKVSYSDVKALTINCTGNSYSAIIYPNPATIASGLNVSLSGYSGTITGRLYNSAGQLVVMQTMVNGTNRITVTGMAAGIYNLVITDAAGITGTYKVVVSH